VGSTPTLVNDHTYHTYYTYHTSVANQFQPKGVVDILFYIFRFIFSFIFRSFCWR